MTKIHKTALVHPSAMLDASVTVGAHAIIEAGVELGEGTQIKSHAQIHTGTKLGKNNTVHAFTCLGSDPQTADFDKNFDAKLVIGDNNVFHQYVTVSKGAQHASGITTIGSGNLFMAHSHAGHDCVIGDHTIMVNHATLAGHVTVDNYAIIGAFCAVHQFCRVGESALMTGGAMVNKDVVPFMVYARNPCKSYGVNKEGLKRRGYSTQTIANIHSAYKLIFKKRYLSKELGCALASISETCKEIEKIIHFIGQSERGVVR